MVQRQQGQQQPKPARGEAEIMYAILEACSFGPILKSHVYNRADFGGGVGNKYVAAMIVAGLLDVEEVSRGGSPPEQWLKTSEKGLMGMIRLKVAIDEVLLPVKEKIKEKMPSGR